MLKLFYSYSHIDEPFREQLEKHLAVLRRGNLIDEWYYRRIFAGQEWHEEIDVHLQSSNIILLLISSDFIASNYCYDIEMQKAIAMHDAGQAAVVPVIIRPCLWTDAPFAKLQALPKDGKAVSTWSNADEAWLSVAEGLKKLCERLHPKAVTQPNPIAISKNKSFSSTTIFQLTLDDQIELSNNNLDDFSKKSCLTITGIRDFDRVIRWPSVVIYGSSELIEYAIRFKGGAKPYANQEFKYILDVKKNGTLIYEQQFTWDNIDIFLFETEKFIEQLSFFILYASNWVKSISTQNYLYGMKQIGVSLRMPKASYLSVPIDLINSGLSAPQRVSEQEIQSTFSIKAIENLQPYDLVRICSHFTNQLMSEFSYTFARQVKFPSLNSDAFQQRIFHLLKMIKREAP